ncbi:hypothetical protein Asulf_01326 [Archaeoglobus sulfaticallidus PM70-1]|uniref:Uncharacterized protein n=1 Tax=Archaeoglobus sulfaticallidus PM70-1 TaxID=387631 RepID=N0BG92_9EURY|nr:hypothetical protein [Archaeoglobus sulfaticallidus]AGK61317.1 hypothetical protein Asulf_01326 [Archaeoglobus sulfaticallidus PM70-1]
MGLRDIILKYPEILILPPTLFVSIGLYLMKSDVSVEHLDTFLVGFYLGVGGIILGIYIGFIIIYVRFLKKEVKKKLGEKIEGTLWNQFMISYIAGIYGGLTVLAANLILSANDIYSKTITTITFIGMMILFGLLGLAGLTYVLETKTGGKTTHN